MEMNQQLLPTVQLRDLITGEMASKAIHVAAELKVSDLLDEGPKTPGELAKAAGAHEQSLYRLLRLLASYGIYQEREDGRFEMTPMAVMLKTGRRTLHSFIGMFASPWNQGPFSQLLHAIKTGDSAFEASMGKPFFDYMAENPEAESLFNSVMTDFLAPVHVAAAKAYDFSGFNKIIDVGGGHGSLMKEIAERYPGPHGVVFDLPSVLEGSRQAVEAADLTLRIDCVAGDFFTEVPEHADAYLLCRIIHDWDDDDAVRILSNCRRAMSAGSKLLLIEQVLRPGNERSFTKVTDIWMMMMFHKGRERTEAEFVDILQRSGFRLNKIIPTEVHDSVIEALPV